MTEIYLHFLFAHYGLYGNAPVLPSLYLTIEIYKLIQNKHAEWENKQMPGFTRPQVRASYMYANLSRA